MFYNEQILILETKENNKEYFQEQSLQKVNLDVQKINSTSLGLFYHLSHEPMSGP